MKAEKPVLTGLIGRGIQLSRSPAMHEAEGTAQGLRYIYRLIDTDLIDPAICLGEILRAAEICGFAGVNITYPFKVEVVAHLDELSEAARLVGAVNTVVFRDGRRSGHNTDFWGFAESFRRDMAGPPRGRGRVIGARRARRGVAQALIRCGVQELLVSDIDPERACQLAQAVCAAYGDGRATAFGDVATAMAEMPDGLVNATPVGMASAPGCPIAETLITPAMWVADVIYFPLETELLRIARQKGCRTLPGFGMAVFQAVRAFELFTGIETASERMEATFRTFDTDAPADARKEPE